MYLCKHLLLLGVCIAFLCRSFCLEVFASFYAYVPSSHCCTLMSMTPLRTSLLTLTLRIIFAGRAVLISYQLSVYRPMFYLIGIGCYCLEICTNTNIKEKKEKKEWGIRNRLNNSEYQRLPLLLKSTTTWLLIFNYYSWPTDCCHCFLHIHVYVHCL